MSSLFFLEIFSEQIITNKISLNWGQKYQTMKNEDKLVRVFSGSEVSVILLKAKLEEVNISSVIQNDFQSGISAGFAGSTPTGVDLYIREGDLTLADPILQKFQE